MAFSVPKSGMNSPTRNAKQNQQPTTDAPAVHPRAPQPDEPEGLAHGVHFPSAHAIRRLQKWRTVPDVQRDDDPPFSEQREKHAAKTDTIVQTDLCDCWPVDAADREVISGRLRRDFAVSVNRSDPRHHEAQTASCLDPSALTS